MDSSCYQEDIAGIDREMYGCGEGGRHRQVSFCYKKGYEKFILENRLLHIWNQEISIPSVYTIFNRLDMKHPTCRMYCELHS